ncbi:MAG: hypothetical protein MZV70_17745 [Desulfobacterales bacterium]|nr:hypothetical protein [Desulfobacterales bacterium]
MDCFGYRVEMNAMKNSCNDARLIIGLRPSRLRKDNSGKMPRRKACGAIRLAPDEWMDALSINLYDVKKVEQEIEALQWKLGQELLKLGACSHYRMGNMGKIRTRHIA